MSINFSDVFELLFCGMWRRVFADRENSCENIKYTVVEHTVCGPAVWRLHREV
jgi:hypothetical protein